VQNIIVHHYWQSPVAEKVRVALGILDASWQSVEIPRIPPKPDLVLLTGGYRRTPVMQIGADIYCDSQCILQQLDHCFPEANFINAGQTIQTMGFAQWANGALFDHVVRIVIGHDIDSLPPEFLQDRARLYFGPNWTKESISAGVSQSLAECESVFYWMQQTLAMGNEYLSGSKPTLIDVLCYYVVWFLRGRYANGPTTIAKYNGIDAWENRLQQIGYGQYQDLSSNEAIEIASHATPLAISDDQAVTSGLGQQVSIEPDSDGGDPAVEGKLAYVSANEIVVERQNERVGSIHVHFPRTGYRINRL